MYMLIYVHTMYTKFYSEMHTIHIPLYYIRENHNKIVHAYLHESTHTCTCNCTCIKKNVHTKSFSRLKNHVFNYMYERSTVFYTVTHCNCPSVHVITICSFPCSVRLTPRIK